MTTRRTVRATLLLMCLALVIGGCEAPDGAEPSEPGEVVDGELAEIVLPNDSVVARGLAVWVRRRDGERERAIFRGPPRLLEALTSGTSEFREGGIMPARVRVLEPGEEIRPGGG